MMPTILKIMDASLKAIKVEAERGANEEPKYEEEHALEVLADT